MPAEPVRILVVDDFQPWRHFVRSILEGNAELQVICEVSDGLEAVQKASQLKPDLILLDIGLPNLNGIEAAKQIHRVAPDAQILFLTANSDADLAQAALSNGAYGYVLKADAGKELLPAIEAVLRGRHCVSSSLTDRVQNLQLTFTDFPESRSVRRPGQ